MSTADISISERRPRSGQLPVEAPPHRPSRLTLALDGCVGGGLVALGTMAAIVWAPWWVLEIVGFLSAPILLATYVLAPGGVVAASIALLAGSIALYTAYAVTIARCRSEQSITAWIMVFLLVHAACLIAWIGLVIGGVVDGLAL